MELLRGNRWESIVLVEAEPSLTVELQLQAADNSLGGTTLIGG